VKLPSIWPVAAEDAEADHGAVMYFSSSTTAKRRRHCLRDSPKTDAAACIEAERTIAGWSAGQRRLRVRQVVAGQERPGLDEDRRLSPSPIR
jgi:hypothetical protein